MSSSTEPHGLVGEHRELVTRVFPELGVRTLDAIGAGWTFHTYEVNGEWIVQLPRNDYASERLLEQIERLPSLARELSTSIPSPVFVSRDPPAMGYRKLDGIAADRAPDGLWPERLGRALYDLHSVPPEFIGLRAKTAEQVRSERRPACDRLSDVVVPRLEPKDRDRAEALVGSFLDEDRLWRFAPCVVHGDLAPEHILVSKTGDLVGILDWEEVGVGDPASDFVWLAGASDAGERALAAYGGAPDATFLERARLIGAFVPWHHVVYGVETGRESLVSEGLREVVSRLP
jgi:aminoglycoside 2''-phosphotransferase